MIFNCLVFVALLLVSYGSTGLFRKHALKQGMMDIPNERSSHSIPTPRGGGIVFVIWFFLIWSVILAWQFANHRYINAGNTYFFFSSLCIAVLGFADDKYNLSAKFRLACQFVVFAVFLYWLVGIPMLNNQPPSIYDANHWFIFLSGFSCFFLIWLTNLYNFMDGIDGLAAVEAIFFMVCIAIFYHDLLFFPLAHLAWILCPLLIGFLLLNFPKAKLFMGDVGSSFLGAYIGLTSLYLASISWVNFMVCIILLAVFITDATLTLINRFFNGDNIFQAHRTHAYQHASRYFGSHVPVTLGITTINLIWLLPWAFFVTTNRVNPIVATMIAYFPIVVLAFLFNAGKHEILNNEVKVRA